VKCDNSFLVVACAYVHTAVFYGLHLKLLMLYAQQLYEYPFM